MSKLEYFRELEYRLRGLPERERQNILAVYEELFQKAIENGKSEGEIAESLGFPRVPNWDALSGAAGGSGGGASRRYASSDAGAEPSGSAGGYVGPRGGFGGPGAADPDGVRPPGGGAGGSARGYVGPQSGFGGPGAAGPDEVRPPADPFREPGSGFTPPRPPYGDSGFAPLPPTYRDPGFAPPSPPPPIYREPAGSGAKSWIAALALIFFNLVFVLGPFFGICGTLAGLWVTTGVLLVSPLFALVGVGFSHDSTSLLLAAFGSLACFGAGLMLLIVMQWITKWFFKLTVKYVQFNWNIIKGA